MTSTVLKKHDINFEIFRKECTSIASDPANILTALPSPDYFVLIIISNTASMVEYHNNGSVVDLQALVSRTNPHASALRSQALSSRQLFLVCVKHESASGKDSRRNQRDWNKDLTYMALLATKISDATKSPAPKSSGAAREVETSERARVLKITLRKGACILDDFEWVMLIGEMDWLCCS